MHRSLTLHFRQLSTMRTSGGSVLIPIATFAQLLQDQKLHDAPMTFFFFCIRMTQGAIGLGNMHEGFGKFGSYLLT